MKSAGAFIGIVMTLKELPVETNSFALVSPKTNFNYNDLYDIYWTGFQSVPESSKIVGRWLAHPIRKGKYGSGRFSVQSTVSVLIEEIEHELSIPKGCLRSDYCATICNKEPTELVKIDIQHGLDSLLDIIEQGIRIAAKYNIKGEVPVNCFGIDRRLLSQMRREHTRLGIWPN